MKKTTSPYVLLKSSKIHGTGVYAKIEIENGTRIIEYVGEKITKAESERRSDIPLNENKKNSKKSYKKRKYHGGNNNVEMKNQNKDEMKNQNNDDMKNNESKSFFSGWFGGKSKKRKGKKDKKKRKSAKKH